jgi:enoyl-CoA hydratase
MKEYRDILTIKRQRHGIVQLNRPEKMNALSHNLRAELFDALKDFEADPDVKVIIIRGSGRAFSAGYDLSGISETPDDRDYVDRRSGLPNVGPIHPGQGQWPQHLLSGYWIIWELAKPVIAQVHGYCLAGGTELASMCDLMFVAEDAIIGYPPLRAMTSVDIIYHPWHMHQRKVRELLYTGDSVTGKEAVELGWANRAYPVDQLAEATEAFAERIANIDSALLQMTKRQINRAYEIMGIRTALAVGGDIQELSRVRPGGGEFGRIAREKGLKAALDWRDGPFGDYGSAPADAPRPAPAPW